MKRYDVYRVLYCDVHLYISKKPPREQKTLGESRAAIIKSHKQHPLDKRGNKTHARQNGGRAELQASSVYTQKGTMKDVLARCFKKTDVQVCTLTSVYIVL
jgi:hypothetical protein